MQTATNLFTFSPSLAVTTSSLPMCSRCIGSILDIWSRPSVVEPVRSFVHILCSDLGKKWHASFISPTSMKAPYGFTALTMPSNSNPSYISSIVTLGKHTEKTWCQFFSRQRTRATYPRCNFRSFRWHRGFFCWFALVSTSLFIIRIAKKKGI